MNIHISKTNSKLGDSILSLNMPKGITCAPGVPCARKCYAGKGHFSYGNVKQSHMDNLNAYKENPDKFFEEIAERTKLCLFFRWHSSGDIVDAAYLEGMARVARKNPMTHYLAFTKKNALVNAFLKDGHKLPKNLHIVFSAWGPNFPIENPYDFPVAYVRFKDKALNALIPHTAIPCGGKCYKCLACWQLKKGQTVMFDEH